MSCEELRKAAKSWKNLSWDELRAMEKLKGAEKRNVQVSWLRRDDESLDLDVMRRDENSCDQLSKLRQGEKTREGMRWKKLRRQDMRWDETG